MKIFYVFLLFLVVVTLVFIKVSQPSAQKFSLEDCITSSPNYGPNAYLHVVIHSRSSIKGH